ncbi:MAG TPA: fibrinogen-like YCDxxxxGGGW domain-containing protein [Kofleriaceae bacterium]|nr:fibrinogen-like YCDxxxxGGGW domain-containing protein [Kofleriaceae bacterium]
MGPGRACLVAVVLAACASKHAATPADAAPTGCTVDSECSAPTPVCDPAMQTCVECRFSSQCTADAQICQADACRPATSCQEIATELPGLPAGVFTIDLDGASGPAAPLQAYCEAAAGGGWMLVQRTVWSWTDSQALLTSFATWASSTIGMPDAGHAYRIDGSLWPTIDAHGAIMIEHRIRTTTGGACDPLYYVGSADIAVDTSGQTATLSNLTQPVPIVANTVFSASDVGPFDTSCVAMDDGVPWFYNGCCSTCPTFGGSYWTDTPHPMEAYTTTADALGNTEATACTGKTIQVDQIPMGGTFRGVDSMEIYLK